jgi:hypothetical protein
MAHLERRELGLQPRDPHALRPLGLGHGRPELRRRALRGGQEGGPQKPEKIFQNPGSNINV